MIVVKNQIKLAYENVYWANEVGYNVLQLQEVGDFVDEKLSASTELDKKHKDSFNHRTANFL